MNMAEQAEVSTTHLGALEEEARMFKELYEVLESRQIKTALIHQRKHAVKLFGLNMYADTLDGIAACCITHDSGVSHVHLNLILDYRMWLKRAIRADELLPFCDLSVLYDPLDCNPNHKEENANG